MIDSSPILTLAQALAKRLTQAEKQTNHHHHHHHHHNDLHAHHHHHLLRGGQPRTLNLRPEVEGDPSSSSIAECLQIFISCLQIFFPTQIHSFNQNILFSFEKLLSYLKHFSHIWQVSLTFYTFFIYLKKKNSHILHISLILEKFLLCLKISQMFEINFVLNCLLLLGCTLNKSCALANTHSVHSKQSIPCRQFYTKSQVMVMVLTNIGGDYIFLVHPVYVWVNNSLSYFHSAVHIYVQIYVCLKNVKIS